MTALLEFGQTFAVRQITIINISAIIIFMSIVLKPFKHAIYKAVIFICITV